MIVLFQGLCHSLACQNTFLKSTIHGPTTRCSHDTSKQNILIKHDHKDESTSVGIKQGMTPPKQAIDII